MEFANAATGNNSLEHEARVVFSVTVPLSAKTYRKIEANSFLDVIHCRERVLPPITCDRGTSLGLLLPYRAR